MEKILSLLSVPILLYFAYRNFYQAKKIEDEKYEKEKKLKPEQKIQMNLKQDQKHKIFLYLIPVGVLLMYVLKNTLVGYFIGFGTLGLAFKIWFELFMRWTKNQPFNKFILIISFILFIILITLLGALFWPQLEFIYQNKLK